MDLCIIGTDLPGISCGCYRNVHVGIQDRKEPAQVVPADADRVEFSAEISVVDRDGLPDFRSSAVQGRPGERFVYLTWGDVSDEGFGMFRRAKLMLGDIGPSIISAADQPGHRLEAHVVLTDEHAMPRCARIKPPHISWLAAPTPKV